MMCKIHRKSRVKVILSNLIKNIELLVNYINLLFNK